jgi:CMP/dCMP kinase
MDNLLSVSIDGPTASGKTTLGAGLARDFAGTFIDSGLTYRALAYALVRGDLPEDESWRSFIKHYPQSFKLTPGIGPRNEAVDYNGLDITEDLWSFDVDNRLENVARSPQRRNEIADFHREIIGAHSTVIVAGRDIATTILANATLHVFLNANFAVRRERRRAQHRSHPERSVVVGAITERDLQTLAEIRMKSNSLVIDTTYMPVGVILQQAESWLIKDGNICERS